MQNQLDAKSLLHSYNLVVSKGNQTDGRYHLDGIQAWSDFDGYTVFLGNQKVTLTLQFHGKYHADYQSVSDFDLFIKQLSKLNHRQ